MKKLQTSEPLLLLNIKQLITLRSASTARGPKRGVSLNDLSIIEDGAVLCLAGKIVSAGRTNDALQDAWFKRNKKRVRVIECRGRVVLPGFVDSHTHPAFVSPRLIDFEKRISGASYEQIAASGGGIRSSVEDVRNAPKSQLSSKILAALREMSEQGTTTVEAKSGYGLTLDSELKSLEAIRLAAAKWPGTLVPTLLGAHVVPPEFESKREEYVKLVCEEMIPQAAQRNLAQFVDVFCDRGAFTEEDSVKIFEA